MTTKTTPLRPEQPHTSGTRSVGLRATVLFEHAMPAQLPAQLDRLIITIDGPAGTGKSSVARALAARLGLRFLDTGAMYRAATGIVLDNHLDPTDHVAIVDAVERADLHFDFDVDPPELRCAGKSVMHRLRTPDVTRAVSQIAAIRELRQDMVRKQRQIANAYPKLVAEGRDQGSVVFPDADVKFYLDATPMVRAERRAAQLEQAGTSCDVPSLAAEIQARDEFDSSRPDSPLVCPADAHVVDTSRMTFESVVAALETHVRRLVMERETNRPMRMSVQTTQNIQNSQTLAGPGGVLA
jgi:CMP/dCMP kinase